MIEYLLESRMSITVQEIAEQLDVSVRTIHRDLKDVEDTLENYQLHLIKKTGVGLSVSGTVENKQRLQKEMKNVASLDYTPDERQTIILMSLFATREPIKLFAFASDLQVTISTVSNDLDVLEEQLKEHNLKLLRRRGYGVQIKGEERNKRQAINNLITTYIDPFELVSLYKKSKEKKLKQQDNIAERLLDFVQTDRLEVIESSVAQIKNDLPYDLADKAYIGLIVHLALAVERLKNGDTIDFDENYLQQISTTEEFKAATLLIQSLEKELDMTIPKEEIGYITMHLFGAKLRADHSYVIEDSTMDIAYKVNELIQYVNSVLDVQLDQSNNILNDLVVHLKPAIYRINKEMKITNPIIDDIERDYKDLFKLLTDAVKVVFPELEFPRDEIGYLVLHFGSVLYYNSAVKHVKVLVICASGIGTAKILATQLQQQFPEITQVKNISMFELEQINPDNYDLVLSTVYLTDTSIPYIVVSPIMKEEERIKIKHKLRQMLVTYKTQESLDKQVDYTMRIEQIHYYNSLILGIINRFKVEDWMETATAQTFLQVICSDLRKKQYVNDEDIIYQKLLTRENLGGMGIPDSTVALYHTRTDEVIDPVLLVYRLPNSIYIKGMQNDEQAIDIILMMLAPESARQELLEIFSFISSLLVQDIEFIQLLEKGTELQIKQFLSMQLYQFMKDNNFI